MYRLVIFLTSLLMVASSSMAASTTAPKELEDLYLGEVLYYAFQEEWFDAIARLDTELDQHHELDEPELDSLFPHIGMAEFAVGDFELAYRMHQRAGRAITSLINGNVPEEVRNEAIFRLAKIYFQKDQPVNALHALERISGTVPEKIRDDLAFLRSQILMVNGHFEEAVKILMGLENVESLEGFAGYNLGIALLMVGQAKEGFRHLDLSGRIDSNNPITLAIKDKSNLVLGDKLMGADKFDAAKEVFDRVRLEGAFSNRALLGSGWADASADRFERALVPWSILVEREVTDLAVQEAMLAVPYAYGKLGVYSKAAVMYNSALAAFTGEIEKLEASIKSIREGTFLRALVREELKQDSNWVVKLRNLPEAPETYYLLELMASHDFQESLKNYLDLEQLRRKLESWTGDLEAFEEIIEKRRAYYQPLLPEIDKKFRLLDSQMRLRLEQRDRIQKRLQAMLIAPRPDYLATAGERIFREKIDHLQKSLSAGGADIPNDVERRIRRLRGLLDWNIHTDYDRRLTEAYQNLHELNQVVEMLQQQYDSFVRNRQAATQSYQGYDDSIRRQRSRIVAGLETVKILMARQGHMLENMAINELSKNRERLEKFQVKVLFAMADSYDRAARAGEQNGVEQ
jgi:tetratricopeptide (TPR) repeat protein